MSGSVFLAVTMVLAQAPERGAATTGPTTQRAARLCYDIAGPVRLTFAGQSRYSEYRRLRQEWTLAEQRDSDFASTVYLAPVERGRAAAGLQVLLCRVTNVIKDTASGRDVTAETRRRPSQGRSIALDEYHLDATGRVLLAPTTTRPAESIFTLFPGRHREVPVLPRRGLLGGKMVQERIAAREGEFVLLREMAAEPVEEAGRSCVRLTLQVRQEPGPGRFVVASWSAEQFIERATGLLVTHRSRIRYIVGPYRRDVTTAVKGAAAIPISLEAFANARAERQALQAIGQALRDGSLKTAETQLADIGHRFKEPAFPEKRAQLEARLEYARALAAPTAGERRLFFTGMDTYFWLRVPADYDPAKRYKLLILLHGARVQPEVYFRSWIEPLEGKGFILAALKSRGHSWNPNLDRAVVKRLVQVVNATYRIDREKVFLLGHSAGATMAYVAALAQKDVPFRGEVIVAGTLHRQLRGDIRRQADKDLLDRVRRMSFYVLVGANDRQFSPRAVKGDADLLKGAGAQVTFRQIPDWEHDYPTKENPAIADWLDGQ